MNIIRLAAGVVICAAFAGNTWSATSPPLKLITRIPVPGEGGGDFDHFAIDLKHNRLFSCDQGHRTIEVFDIEKNTHIRTIGPGVIQLPHSLLYREDLNRLYVVDGSREVGAVRIYDGKDYSLIKNIDLPPLADWSGYDPATKYLYVNGNGVYVKKLDSTVSIIDTTSGELVGQFTIDDNVITDFAMDTSTPNIYTGMRNKSRMAVIDRKARKVIASWPVTLGQGLGHEALDTENHRLFVNCRSGQMVIFDTQTGKELQALPINTFSDDLSWDQKTKRLYVTASGPKEGGKPSVEVIQEIDPDHYKSLGVVPTEIGAKTGILVPERHRFYVAAPKRENNGPQVLVYEVQ